MEWEEISNQLFGLLTSSWAWISSSTVESSVWLADVGRRVFSGEFGTLTAAELTVCLLLLTIAVASLVRIFARIRSKALHDEGRGDGYVLHEGRWVVRGYRDPVRAEQRRQQWRSKLMTPDEQQRYIDRVREGKVEDAEKLLKPRVRRTRILRWLLYIVFVFGFIAYLAPDDLPQDASRAAEIRSTIPSKQEERSKHGKEFKKAGSEMPINEVAGLDKAKSALPTMTVARILSGDTVVVLDENEEIILHLYGLVSPEPGQPHGEKAKKALERMAGGISVEVEVIETDSDQKRYAILYRKGESLNRKMVCGGHAWWDKVRSPEDKALKDCQRVASTMAVGLWAGREPVPPWEWKIKK